MSGKSSLQGLPASNPDSFEARYPAAAEATADNAGRVSLEPAAVLNSDGFGDDRMDEAQAGAVTVPAHTRRRAKTAAAPASKPAADYGVAPKYIRVTMQLDAGTFTTPALWTRVCEYGVLVAVPNRDDIATFTPAPGTELKVSLPGREPLPCYYPGTCFPDVAGGFDILVFIRGSESGKA